MEPEGRQSAATIAAIGITVGVLFSLVYLGLYPMLIGGSVIYWYPYWPAPLAMIYVVTGIVIQGWFCYRQATNPTWRALAAQAVIGIGYLAATLLSGSEPYMS